MTSDTFFSKLKNLKQIGSIQKFSEIIESTADQLESALLQEGYSMENANKVATNAGVNALSAGVKNARTQIVLEAGNFEKLSQAITKALEIDNRPSQANVFTQKRVGGGRYNSRFNGNNQNGYNRNQNGNNQNRNQNGYNQNNRTDRYGRGGFNNHRYHQQNQPGSSRQVFVNRSENDQIPQQNNRVGGRENQANVTIAQVQNQP